MSVRPRSKSGTFNSSGTSRRIRLLNSFRGRKCLTVKGKFFVFFFLHDPFSDGLYLSYFTLLSLLLFCQSSCLFPSDSQISFNHWRHDAVFWWNAFPGHSWWRELKALPILLKCKSSPNRFHASRYRCFSLKSTLGWNSKRIAYLLKWILSCTCHPLISHSHFHLSSSPNLTFLKQESFCYLQVTIKLDPPAVKSLILLST